MENLAFIKNNVDLIYHIISFSSISVVSLETAFIFQKTTHINSIRAASGSKKDTY
jgi:hypothetical protein